ncbi:hypothetical protein PLESTB_000689200 [Pleodorina starrii]|uniref:Uncharacterized protein n=1 Tax=Pleodorina starrii TaxID=330485 RepID=A0A9W6BJE8_9CHLO|nr:hypothetical protein PLESTB_000689200 [Pleodorina starrii]
MAAPTSNGQESGGLQPELSSAPVGRGGRDRRASLVIKETAQLLNGLHQDADRSSALMAELEALLAAAHHASEQLQDLSSWAPYEGDENTVARQALQFAAVEPMRVENSDGEAEAEGGAEGEAEARGEVQGEAEGEAKAEGEVQAGAQAEGAEACEEPVSPAPLTPPPPCDTTKRRSSVVTFDGAALFGGGLPPAVGGGGGGSVSQLMPGPPPAAARAMSFNRGRAFTLQAGRSFTERSGTSGTLRRNALTDVGGGGGSATPSLQLQQQQHQFLTTQQCSGPSMSAMASALASITAAGGSGGGVPRRPSSTDTIEFIGPAAVQQARRSSGLSYTTTTSGGAAGMASHGQVFMGPSILRDDSGDGGGFDGLSPGMGFGQDLGLGSGGGGGGGGGGNGSGGVPARMSGGGGGGRFMKMLKGIFQSHSADTASPASPATPAKPVCGSPSAATAPNLESILTHGALSSMTPVPVRVPSRSQVTRGSLGNASFTADPVRRASSVQRHLSLGHAGPTSSLSTAGGGGGAPPPLAVGRSASNTSFQYGSQHALVPTPPTSAVQPPQLTLRRQTSGSGAMAMGTSTSSGPATPTALLSPAGSVCISPSSPGTTLYGMMAPSTADWRLLAGGGLPTSRRSLHLPTPAGGLRGQL